MFFYCCFVSLTLIARYHHNVQCAKPIETGAKTTTYARPKVCRVARGIVHRSCLKKKKSCRAIISWRREGGRPWNCHCFHVFSQHFNLISGVAVRNPRPWIHLDLAALVNGFEAQPQSTLTLHHTGLLRTPLAPL